MQGDRDKKFYLGGKAASLQRRVCQEAQDRIELGFAILEAKNHRLEGLTIHAAPGNGVEIYLTTLTIGTRALD